MKENERNFTENDPLSEKIKNFLDLDDDDISKLEDHQDGSGAKLPSTYECYELESKIDQGGVKEISQMRDYKTGRSIAMATLRPEFQKVEHINRFLREARILASLEHPNIVPLYDIGYYDNDLPFFSMKLLKGETLAKALENEGNKKPEERNPDKLLDVFNKVCDAISYAHSNSITHLDLKPENIQISEHGEVLVLDWGFAKKQSDKETGIESLNEIESLHSPTITNITRVGAVNGTPGYMSPEQVRGDRSELDERSDIYALGAILYNIITLKRPYKGDTVEMILSKTKDGITPEIANNLKDPIPGALIAITETAMHHDPRMRYQSVKELQADISAYMHGYATRAENADLMREIALLIKRNRKPLAILTIFSTIVLSLIFFSVITIQETAQRGVIEKTIAVKKEKEKSVESVLKAYNIKLNKLLNEYKFKEALKATKDIQDAGYNHPELWLKEALLQFGEFNFDRAYFCIEKAKGSSKVFSEESKNAIEFFESSKNKIEKTDENIVYFSRNSPDDHLGKQIIWNTNIDSSKSIDEKVSTLRQLLRAHNDHIAIEDIKINYGSVNGQYKLDLSKTPRLRNLIPIIGLPCNELNISNTSIDSINYLRSYFIGRVSKLDVSNTKLNFHMGYLLPAYKSLTARNTIFTAYRFGRSENIEYLDLENSTIYLRNFRYPLLKLKYLNIAGTKTRDMTGLLKLPTLHTLVIDDVFDQNSPTLTELKERGVNIILKASGNNQIPGIIEAENYSSMNGIVILKKDGNTFDKYITNIDKGDELSYKIQLENNDTFETSFKVQPGSDGAYFDLINNGQTLLKVRIPPNDKSKAWSTHSEIIQLAKGESTLKLKAFNSGWKIDKINFNEVDNYIPLIPGKIEAENYNATSHSEGGKTSAIKDVQGGTFVGWIEKNTYYNYIVNVNKSGRYKMTLRLASMSAPEIEVKIDDQILSQVIADKTGDYHKYEITSHEVELPQGIHTISIWPKSKGWNMDWIKFEALE